MIQDQRKPDPIPRLDRVLRGEALSAAKQNRVVGAINRLTQGTRPPRQVPLVPRPRSLQVTDTVVLTVAPVSTDLSLTVRKVKYVASPPIVGEPPALAGYVWNGEQFTAFPDFGTVAFDYADSFNVIETVPTVGDTFLQVFTHQGVSIVELPGAVEAEEAFDVTALTVRPTESDTTLTVRKLQYAGNPPVQGEYVWVDQPFIAFPDFGKTAVDYADLFKALGAAPVAGDNFLRVFKDRGDPIVEFPAAEVETVVLRVKPVAEDTVLRVRKVRFVDSPPQPARMNWDGNEFDAFPDFGKRVLDYEPFVEMDIPDQDTMFLRLFKHEGDPIVEFPATGGGEGGQVKELTIVRHPTADTVVEGIVDHLVCVDNDGETILVALPWFLRMTPFDRMTRNSVRYTYSGNPTRRNAAIGFDPGVQQKQTIIPSYQIGDRVAAIHVPGGTDVIWNDTVNLQSVPIDWLELNQGRAWSRSGL